MYVIHEGEIILKEKYSSSNKERLYVKPPDEADVVLIDDSPTLDVSGWFAKIFLPQGFPGSVSKDYMQYQFWDTAQAFCSTIAGTLATQEVLRGVGVGDSQATPLAATITWILKDGCGHVARILFAYTHGSNLDAYSKKWRLYADVINDVAMCIEIAMPLFKDNVTLVLCITTMMKAVVGVAGGATRLAMTQHHAVRGNMADVSAKDSAQETAVNLIASVVALIIINILGSCIPVFVLMVLCHISCNYMAVRAVCLHTLNEPRYLQVIASYLLKEVIPIPCEINRIEPVVFYQHGSTRLDVDLCGFEINMGYSIKKVITANPLASRHLGVLKDIYENSPYILYPNISERKIYVFIKQEANTDAILCSYFHSVLLSIITCAINDVPLTAYTATENPRPFAEICRTIQAADWSREPKDTLASPGDLHHNPSYELMTYVSKIVQNEWRRSFYYGLRETGWDVRRHLLVMDEWRIIPHTLGMENDDNVVWSQKTSLQSNFTTSHKSLFNLVGSENYTNTIDAYTIEPDAKGSNLDVRGTPKNVFSTSNDELKRKSIEENLKTKQA